MNSLFYHRCVICNRPIGDDQDWVQDWKDLAHAECKQRRDFEMEEERHEIESIKKEIEHD